MAAIKGGGGKKRLVAHGLAPGLASAASSGIMTAAKSSQRVG